MEEPSSVQRRLRERSGSVLECLTGDRGAAGSSPKGVTAKWSLSKTIYHSLVLVQPRKTRPCLTERLLVGRKESNHTHKQTNKQTKAIKYLKIGKFREGFIFAKLRICEVSRK